MSSYQATELQMTALAESATEQQALHEFHIGTETILLSADLACKHLCLHARLSQLHSAYNLSARYSRTHRRMLASASAVNHEATAAVLLQTCVRLVADSCCI